MRQSTLDQLLTARKGAVAQAEAAELTLRAIDDAIGGTYSLADDLKRQPMSKADVHERLTGPENQPAGAFDQCPYCGSTAMVRLAPDLIDRSGVPIVGCGNPWHYFSPRPEVKALTAAELPSFEPHPRETARWGR